MQISSMLDWRTNCNISRNDIKKLLCVYCWVQMDMEIESAVLFQLSAQLHWYTAWFTAVLSQLMVLSMMFAYQPRLLIHSKKKIAVWNITTICIHMLRVTFIWILNDTVDAVECIGQLLMHIFEFYTKNWYTSIIHTYLYDLL